MSVGYRQGCDEMQYGEAGDVSDPAKAMSRVAMEQ